MCDEEIARLVAGADPLATRKLLERNPELARRLHSVAKNESAELGGFYHRNVQLGNLLIRFPLEGDQLDLRTFYESVVLRAVQPYLGSKASRLIYEGHGWTVLAFERGRVLHEVAPPGEAVPRHVLDALAELPSELTRVPWQEMPLPHDWPEDGDSVAFADRMADHTAAVYRNFRSQFGREFDRLLPDNLLEVLFSILENLADRPFQLLHNDVHRENVLVRSANSTVFLDWELATVGDWVFDLATHLHYMRYTSDDRKYLLRRCVEKMHKISPELTEGWEQDLEDYLGFKLIKSGVDDTIRNLQYVREGSLSPDQVNKRALNLTPTLNGVRRICQKEELSPPQVANVLAGIG